MRARTGDHGLRGLFDLEGLSGTLRRGRPYASVAVLAYAVVGQNWLQSTGHHAASLLAGVVALLVGAAVVGVTVADIAELAGD